MHFIKGEVMIKIYGYRLSPFVDRIFQVVRTKGLEDKFEFCPIPEGGLKGEEYLALNPLGKMPIMIDGDLCMPESAIICEYIEAKFPQVKLYPDNLEELTAVKLICRMLDAYVFQNMFDLASMARETGEKPDVLEQKLAQINAGLDLIERFIGNEDGKFLVGDSWSVADCAMISADFYFVKILQAMKIEPYANRPKLKAWHDVQVDSPIVQETNQVMEKELVAFLSQIKEN